MPGKKSPSSKKPAPQQAGTNSVHIGGNVSDSNILVGNNNTINQSVAIYFKPIYKAIQQSQRTPAEKADLTADVKEIEEIAKSENVDESFLSCRLRNLKHMAPDIAEMALSALAAPGAVAGAVVKKIAEKIKSES